jgi:hypothetical protein
MEVSGQHHSPVTLFRGKNPVPIEKESVWAPESVWTILRRKFLSLAGIRTPDQPAHALVSILPKDTTVNLLPNISNYMTEKIRQLHWRDDTNAQPPTTNFPRDEVNVERVDSVLF